MKLLRFAVLYTALALGANPALGSDLAALRDGTMQKLIFHDAPQQTPPVNVTTRGGAAVELADYRGKIVLVNFWATYCAPCRTEMPSLDALQAELGGDDFDVVTIATGPNKMAAIDRFFSERDIENLPILLDPRSKAARSMGVMALPISVLLDRDGQEIARLIGDADWHSDSARAIVSTLIAGH
ncbi:TlpA disulfide reductase family protein [Aliiroseovarius sp. PTFE2010]|uniref:TlpA disulfide reductase family protein n=1 Tax=Aliiroseovarius sp. PTFE2010 TaxID=3417190 RepID=UPI003CE790EA